MEQESQIQKPKKKLSELSKILIIVAILIVAIIGWASLTRAGYMSNFLKIQLLYKEDGSNVICPSGLQPTRDCGVTLYGTSCGNWKCVGENYMPPAMKPVIYLYPKQIQDVMVQLDYRGKIVADYPSYDPIIHGWRVIVYPDGHLINLADRKEYSYLFWEGAPNESVQYDLSTGFIIKGSDTKEFLQRVLSKIGLTPKEYNEFIVYWYPKMKDNPYNLIHFADKQYTETAPLIVTPKPDSILRVFMVFKPLEKKFEIQPQNFKSFERKAFAVVEWGGTEIK